MGNKIWQRFIVAVALAGAVTGCASLGPRPAGEFAFSATGDGPRGDGDWELLRQYFAMEKEDGRSAFLLHVGDICAGHDTLPEEYYIRVAELFKTSPIPIVIVPGDNEWNDLDDPDQGWAYWERHFLAFEQNFPDPPAVWRQRVLLENVAWVSGGVLFIGLNLVGGTVHNPDEWAARHQFDAAWVQENLDEFGGHVRAAVVFAQAAPRDKHEDFFAKFVTAAEAFGKPVLYLHGDGHAWEHEPGWRAPNILRVQVDAVAGAPPVLVTVTDDPQTPFHFDRRLGP